MLSVFDLHVHTNRGSPDSGLRPEDMVTQAQRRRLNGVVVSEHVGWPQDDFQRFVRNQGLVLIRAREYFTNVGHVIVLGLHDYKKGMVDIRELHLAVKEAGGYMVLAHPYRFLFDPPGRPNRNLLFEDHQEVLVTPEEASAHPVFQLVDELEVVNGCNMQRENRFAEDVAGILGLRGTGGSDAHYAGDLGKGVTLFRGEVRNEGDLLEALRAGAFAPVETFHPGLFATYEAKVP